MTSITIKSIFSISNNIVTKSRNRLDPKLLSKIVLLKSQGKSLEEIKKENKIKEED